MKEPTLAQLLRQYIHNHGFQTTITRPREWHHFGSYSDPNTFTVFKDKTKLGTVVVDDKKLKITFTQSTYDHECGTDSVYDPDSFPRIIDRLKAVYALERQKLL